MKITKLINPDFSAKGLRLHPWYVKSVPYYILVLVLCLFAIIMKQSLDIDKMHSDYTKLTYTIDSKREVNNLLIQLINGKDLSGLFYDIDYYNKITKKEIQSTIDKDVTDTSK